jgi:hypothetical protein
LPPEVERLIVDPVCPGVAKLLTTKADCAPRKLNAFWADVIAAKLESAALVATTTQSVGPPVDVVTVVLPDTVAMEQRAFATASA